MACFRDIAEASTWLENRPRDFSRVIAVRSALRVVPWLMNVLLETDIPDGGREVILALFRGLAASWVASIRLGDLGKFVECNDDAFREIMFAFDFGRKDRGPPLVALAAMQAAFLMAADEGEGGGFALTAIENAKIGPIVAGVDFFQSELSADATELDSGASDIVASARLWRRRIPSKALGRWRRLKKLIDGFPEDENWWVWRDWYEARLKGGPVDRDLETKRVLIAHELWRQGPKVVNAEIAELIEEAKQSKSSQDQEVDFFLSYSKADDAFARWISSLMTGVGFTVFAQFKDIPPGSNFVREMQRGLDASHRLIALLSPDYEKSDQCQSEWSAFYNKDPGGTGRLLVPLLIRPTLRNSLARQIVYKQLIGLSPEDAVKVILEAIGYTGNLQSIPPNFPGTEAIDEIGRKTGGVFQVAPGTSGLLERQPIQPTDSVEAGFTPVDLFAAMAKEIAGFADHLKRGSGNFRCSDRLKDRAARLQSSAEVGLSRCDPLEINKNLVWVLRIIALDKKDGAILPNDEIEYYVSDLYGYYQRLEFIFPQLKAYRKIDARHRFVAPDEHAERAIGEVYASFGSRDASREALSPDLAQEFKSAGEDIENAKANPEIEPGQEAKVISAEAHAVAATKSMSVWGWLANAREKFEKGGQKAADIEKTIANYEKLYKRVAPDMADYIAYLLKWFL